MQCDAFSIDSGSGLLLWKLSSCFLGDPWSQVTKIATILLLSLIHELGSKGGRGRHLPYCFAVDEHQCCRRSEHLPRALPCRHDHEWGLAFVRVHPSARSRRRRCGGEAPGLASTTRPLCTTPSDWSCWIHSSSPCGYSGASSVPTTGYPSFFVYILFAINRFKLLRLQCVMLRYPRLSQS